MKHKILLVISFFVLSSCAEAYELGFRYNSMLTSSGLFDLNMSSEGKLIQGTYVFQPIQEGRFAQNLFGAFGVGRYFTKDFNSPSFWILEASPGVQVQEGVFRARVSQGVAAFNLPGSYIQFVTHIDLGVMSTSGVSISLERTHYSNGVSGANDGGFNLTGVVIGFHL